MPDRFTGGDMLAAGGFCYGMLGWLLVSRKESPASARASDRLLTIGSIAASKIPEPAAGRG